MKEFMLRTSRDCCPEGKSKIQISPGRAAGAGSQYVEGGRSAARESAKMIDQESMQELLHFEGLGLAWFQAED
jgi:hypothetical protein